MSLNITDMASRFSIAKERASTHKIARSGKDRLNLNYSKLRLLILESGDLILNFCQDNHVPVTSHENDFDNIIFEDIKAGVYNCVIIDDIQAKALYDVKLKEISSGNPFIPTIVIGGSLHHLQAGVSESISYQNLSIARLESALFNADRLCKLHYRTEHLEAELSAFVDEDPLTALPGRNKFRNKMKKSIEQARENKTPVSLIVLDLDSFKALNESRGHDFGDQILKTVAKRLFRFAPDNSIVGRLGDDEFALLLNNQDYADTSHHSIAVRLSHEIRKPYIVEGQKTEVSATMGIAGLDEDDTADSLLHKSIAALYSAKRDKTRLTVFTQKDDNERRQQLRWAQDLPDAIKAGELRLHYQPIVQMSSKEVIGVEALVRWQNPKHGLLFPDSFIPLAENSGSIEALTRWVLEAAVAQGSLWLENGEPLSVSVNISALILHNPSFPSTVKRILKKANFPPKLLKLEITESAIISDVSRATEIVNCLHEMGVRISIDDFGTGYTSLSYLRKLPFDEIKIDKSFVLNMKSVADDEVIVRTLVELAKNLSLSVVAEGVEDLETWQLLDNLNCDVAQGYYMSRPIDLDAFNLWIKSQPWRQELK